MAGWALTVAMVPNDDHLVADVPRDRRHCVPNRHYLDTQVIHKAHRRIAGTPVQRPCFCAAVDLAEQALRVRPGDGQRGNSWAIGPFGAVAVRVGGEPWC